MTFDFLLFLYVQITRPQSCGTFYALVVKDDKELGEGLANSQSVSFRIIMIFLNRKIMDKNTLTKKLIIVHALDCIVFYMTCHSLHVCAHTLYSSLVEMTYTNN